LSTRTASSNGTGRRSDGGSDIALWGLPVGTAYPSSIKNFKT
jgi:hypothetical protein